MAEQSSQPADRRAGAGKRPLLGELLKSNGLITQEQLEEALRRQQGSFKLLGEILIEMGAITRSQLTQMLEAQHRLLGSGAPATGGKRILIIEDDVELARTLRDAFKSAGYRPQIALNGAEAMALVLASETRLPNVIILDLGLPLYNGVEILRALKRNEHTKDLPVIVLTGHTDPTEEGQVRELGIWKYLWKPTPLADLLQAVQSAP